MKKNKEMQIIYDEQGLEQINNQIMDAYTSGVVDHPDGQFHLLDQEDKK